MGIDSISGPKGPKGPKGPEQANTKETNLEGAQPTTNAPQATVQSLAQAVRQGSMSYDDAITRFASDVVARRYPTIQGPMKDKAIQEVGRALSQDPNFTSRFARLLSET
jgi:hypothetical protein